MDYQEIKAMLYKIITAIDYMNEINALNDCNSCLCQRNCTHAPKAGQMVRINCFAYAGKEGN